MLDACRQANIGQSLQVLLYVHQKNCCHPHCKVQFTPPTPTQQD